MGIKLARGPWRPYWVQGMQHGEPGMYCQGVSFSYHFSNQSCHVHRTRLKSRRLKKLRTCLRCLLVALILASFLHVATTHPCVSWYFIIDFQNISGVQIHLGVNRDGLLWNHRLATDLFDVRVGWLGGLTWFLLAQHVVCIYHKQQACVIPGRIAEYLHRSACCPRPHPWGGIGRCQRGDLCCWAHDETACQVGSSRPPIVFLEAGVI